MTDDAEIVFFISGAHAHTARYAIHHLRKKGVKIGLVKIRFIRPWPTEELAKILSKFKVVGIVENNNSFGSALSGGILALEVRASLYDSSKKPHVLSFMAGLGGEPITLNDYYFMAEKLAETAKTDKFEKPVYWIGFED